MVLNLNLIGKGIFSATLCQCAARKYLRWYGGHTKLTDDQSLNSEESTPAGLGLDFPPGRG